MSGNMSPYRNYMPCNRLHYVNNVSRNRLPYVNNMPRDRLPYRNHMPHNQEQTEIYYLANTERCTDSFHKQKEIRHAT